MQKILIFGGINSGKSKVAEEITLKIAKEKPYYIATYLDEFEDEQMRKKIKIHQKQREERFVNIEEPYDVSKIVSKDSTYLVDCLSMLIFNNLNDTKRLFSQLKSISTCRANIVFVLNDVSCSVIASNEQTRRFVELSGEVGRIVAEFCDEVYEVKFGLKKRLK